MKLLIRATNWVGDAIMALPALQAVRNRFPAAQISILALPYVADIYRGQGIADDLIPYDRHGEHKGVGGRFRCLGRVRFRRMRSITTLSY